MTRQKRDELKDLSEDAYGNATMYAKMMRKGEKKPEQSQTSTGKTIMIKRWYPITAEEIESRMRKIIADRAIAKAVETLKQKQGGPDGSEKKENQEVGSPS